MIYASKSSLNISNRYNWILVFHDMLAFTPRLWYCSFKWLKTKLQCYLHRFKISILLRSHNNHTVIVGCLSNPNVSISKSIFYHSIKWVASIALNFAIHLILILNQKQILPLTASMKGKKKLKTIFMLQVARTMPKFHEICI